MKLRDYQIDTLTAISAGREQFSKQIVVAPTGSGKTIMFSAMSKDEVEAGGRALILCHREELIDQAIEKLYRSTGIVAGKEKAEWHARMTDSVVVASVQSMIRRLHKWPANHFSLIIPDEGHHSVSDSWQRVLRHFDGSAHVCAFTATPDRMDRRNMGQYYENVAKEISLFDLINQGYLSRIIFQPIPVQIDVGGIGIRSGDYDAQQTSDTLLPYLDGLAEQLKEEAVFRRTLVFLPLIATSQKFVEVLRSKGIQAEHVDGESENRKEILERFSDPAGNIDVLCNAMLLTEGYDNPLVDCILNLRLTKSRSLYYQIIGRGTRTHPGKRNLIVLDPTWQHEAHNLIRPAHLVARCEEDAKEITRIAQEKTASGAKQEELDLEGLASEAQAQREEKLRQALKAQEKRKRREIDAMEFCLSLHQTDVAEYEPSTKWEEKPVTAGQSAMLQKYGLDVDGIKCAGHASKIIDLIVTRSKMGLCTPKQMRALQQMGHPAPATTSFEDASRFLDARWKKKQPELKAA